MSQTPKYDLNAIRQLCSTGNRELIWFSATSRSTSQVIAVYAATDSPKGYKEAVEFILKGLQALTTEDFVESVLQWNTVADVYGLVFDNRPWYVKFIFENGVLEEISFHPPEKPLKTVSGKTIG